MSPKRDSENQKPYSEILIMRGKGVTLVVGKQETTGEYVQYCITAKGKNKSRLGSDFWGSHQVSLRGLSSLLPEIPMTIPSAKVMLFPESTRIMLSFLSKYLSLLPAVVVESAGNETRSKVSPLF